jgi:hypothetical protein
MIGILAPPVRNGIRLIVGHESKVISNQFSVVSKNPCAERDFLRTGDRKASVFGRQQKEPRARWLLLMTDN